MSMSWCDSNISDFQWLFARITYSGFGARVWKIAAPRRGKKKKRSFRGIIFHVFLYFYLTNRIKKMRRLAWLNGCSILLYVFEVLAANYVNRGKNLWYILDMHCLIHSSIFLLIFFHLQMICFFCFFWGGGGVVIAALSCAAIPTSNGFLKTNLARTSRCNYHLVLTIHLIVSGYWILFHNSFIESTRHQGIFEVVNSSF